MDDKNQSTSNGIKEPTRTIHPILRLDEAFNFTLKIYSDLGYTHYHDKEAIARIFNTTYDSIKQKLSSSSQYGLLDLKYGTGYKVTPLFLKLHRPQHEVEKRQGVLEALKSPPLYEKLITEYAGHNLPTEVGLSTTLFRRYGLHEKAAHKAAQVFLNNLNEYGLIGQDNVLLFYETIFADAGSNEPAEPEPGREITLSQPAVTRSGNVEILDIAYLEIPIPLKTGKAYLRVPEGATEEDFQKIARIVEAYK